MFRDVWRARFTHEHKNVSSSLNNNARAFDNNVRVCYVHKQTHVANDHRALCDTRACNIYILYAVVQLACPFHMLYARSHRFVSHRRRRCSFSLSRPGGNFCPHVPIRTSKNCLDANTRGADHCGAQLLVNRWRR